MELELFFVIIIHAIVLAFMRKLCTNRFKNLENKNGNANVETTSLN